MGRHRTVGDMRELKEGRVTSLDYVLPDAYDVLRCVDLHGLGGKLLDRSVYANHGAITGAPWKRLLRGLYALSFDGLTSRVIVTDAPSIQNIFDGAGGSVLAWIYPKSDGEGDFARIIMKVDWSFNVFDELAGFVKLYFIQACATTAGQWKTTNRVVPINTWSLVGLTYDADLTTNDPAFLLGTGGAVTTPAVTEGVTPVGARNSDAASNLIIGNTVATDRTFDGYIALEQLIKGKMITLAEFTSIYKRVYRLLKA